MITDSYAGQQAIKAKCAHPVGSFIEFPKEEIGQSISDRFDRMVAKYSKRIAVKSKRHELTYTQLNEVANRVARAILECCRGEQERIALLLENDAPMIAAILGVLKAGKIYVPLDPSLPKTRLAYMLQDSQASLIVTNGQNCALVNCLNGGSVPWIDMERLDIGQKSENPGLSISPDALTWIFYTSGSTGHPKGVVQTHCNVLHQLMTYTNGLRLCSEDRLTLLHSCSFSASRLDIFGALLNGASLYPFSVTEEGMGSLARGLLDREITLFHWVPTPFRHFMNTLTGTEDFPKLRLIVLGSEILMSKDVELYKKHCAPDCLLVNRFGTTETGNIRWYFIDKESQICSSTVPVGYALEDTEVVLLDDNRQKVGVNEPGEIAVKSRFISPGYWRQPELTRTVFLENQIQRETRMYCTGDRGRILPDGCLLHLGRKDFQVKIRGVRVELGEIEAALARHPGVRESVVIAREDVPGVKQLAAYVVVDPSMMHAINGLRTYLQVKLPDYMIPAAFVQLSSLPRTPNGKVDRRALPAPGRARSADQSALVSPQTRAEEALARIWAEVLRIEQVSVDDNFFELGGDSILGFQIIARAAKAGFYITPQQLFDYPTIQALAGVVGTVAAAQAEQELVTGPFPLTPIMHWFLEQNIPNPHYYNQAVMLMVRQDVDASLLARAVQQLVTHHDVLRLRCLESETGYQPFIAEPEEDIPFLRVDGSAFSDTAEAHAAEGGFMQDSVQPEPIRATRSPGRTVEIASAELQRTLSLSCGPLIRVAFFEFGPGRSSRLLICIHHFAVDSVSWRILLEDLQTAYEQLHRGESVQLSPKTTSFKQWARYLLEYARSGALHEELPYWLAESRRHVSRLPVDFPAARETNTVDSSRRLSKCLTVEETRILLHELPEVYQSQINDVLLTALVQAFAAWTGERSLLVDLEGHGREDIGIPVDLTRSVGWFTTIFPVLLDLDNASNMDEALKLVKEQLRKIPNHGIGYGLLRYLSGNAEISELLHKLSPAEVRFNYLGQFDQTLSGSSFFTLTREPCGPTRDRRGVRPYLIDVFGSVVGGQLQTDWTFSENVHRRAAIEGLAQRFIKELRYLIAHCRSKDIGDVVADLEAISEEEAERLVLRDRLGSEDA
jgi:amino acid adenylation domain-containing protein/non-ribosomal peptide synthase protein (TIGR01720 family)